MSEDDLFASVARRLSPGGRLERSWPLVGGVSAAVQGLQIREADGSVRRVVVRRPQDHGWKPGVGSPAATEFALLEALGRRGIEVPRPLFYDDSGQITRRPYLVMEFVDGTTEVEREELPEALRQMAVYLARLHGLEVQAADLPALPAREDPVAGCLESLPHNALGSRLRRLLAPLGTPQRLNPPALLHGDFWPGNVLWNRGALAAVVDWEDAALGDPLSDLACCRVELLCQYDAAAMHAFTEHYRELSNLDFRGLPLWEVYVSSAAVATMAHWGLAPEVEAARRRTTLGFLERAASRLLASDEGLATET